MYKLNYVTPDGQVVSLDKIRNWDDQLNMDWLYSMVESNPETNFFFTVDTTDLDGVGRRWSSPCGLEFADPEEAEDHYRVNYCSDCERLIDTRRIIIFDENNKNWLSTPEANHLFLRSVENYCNQLLDARGYLFLNEVLKALDLAATRDGSIMGWFKEEGSKSVVFEQTMWSKFEICLDTDGIIYQKLPA